MSKGIEFEYSVEYPYRRTTTNSLKRSISSCEINDNGADQSSSDEASKPDAIQHNSNQDANQNVVSNPNQDVDSGGSAAC